MGEEGDWNLISDIDLGEVEETGKYTAWFKYRGKTFRKYSIIDVYGRFPNVRVLDTK